MDLVVVSALALDECAVQGKQGAARARAERIIATPFCSPG
jgi:hypothetical protein